jgi:hypothetical protein
MKKINFNVIQHTPLIHFETHNISNPTIRLTELKSKFDKFLISNCTNLKIYKDEQGRKYLKYKVMIDSDSKIESFSNGSLFFGNMGEGDNKKYSIASNIKISFFTFDRDLQNCINQNFKKFLANTNFGSRQSKGFGSFFVDEKFDVNLILAKNVYKITIKNAFQKILVNKKKNIQEYKWRNHLALFYQFLRQGINLKNRNNESIFYTKPAIFSYALSKNQVWEKKAIKQHCLSEYFTEQQKKYPSSDVLHSQKKEFIIRDLLGLSSDQRWMSYKINIKKENPHITRFKSPIIFKPIKNGNDMDIYFFKDPRSEEKIEDFLDKEFTIIAGKCKMHLSTPKSFDIDEFVEFSKNINLSKHIETEYHSHFNFKTLQNIYNTFKKVK